MNKDVFSTEEGNRSAGVEVEVDQSKRARARRPKSVLLSKQQQE
jgi:hypothetical protein